MELLSAFKDEAYDDAFLDEVTQKEVEALSPLCSPSLAFAGKERVVDFGWKHSQQREGLPAKKLVFPPIEHEDFNFTWSNSGHIPSDKREREIENWYFDLIQQGHPSYATRPSLEILKAHGALSQEKLLLILTHFPRGGWEGALSVDELQRYKECSIDEVDGRVCQHAQYYKKASIKKVAKVSVKHQDLTAYRPHYMKEDKHERERWIKDEFYISKSILGKIYDFMKQHYETTDCTSALERMSQEDTFIEKRFCYEGYKDYWNVWEEHIREYNRLTTLYLKDECEGKTSQIESLIEEYRKKLYKADTLSESEEPLDVIYKQASAIYIIVYNRAHWLLQQQGREISLPLQFAWKVAGYALIQMYIMREKCREPLLFDESVLRQLKFYKRNRHEPCS